MRYDPNIHNHKCEGLETNNFSYQDLGVDMVINIEFFIPQGLWLLRTSLGVPPMIITHCPFCGLELENSLR